MGRYLIVANQTLGGEKLDRVVRERIERGRSEFRVLVPLTTRAYERFPWGGDIDFPVGEGMTRRIEEDHAAMLDEARQRAERRLREMIDKLRSLGGEADGEVGDPDPLTAVETVLEHDLAFDEVIVSTLPAGISRWLRMDLPSRLARLTEIPVTTVEATDAPTRGATG